LNEVLGIFLGLLISYKSMETIVAAAMTNLPPNKSLGPQNRAFSIVKTSIQLEKRSILFSFRALVFLVILVLLFFNERNNGVLFEWRVLGFLAVFGVSLAVMFAVPEKWIEKKAALSIFFVLDTIFIASGLYLAGLGDSDLFLIFFTTVFISALSRDVKSVFAVATVSCSLYLFLRYKSTGVFFPTDTEMLLSFPFLFVAAALSGYLAMEGQKSEEEKGRLEDINRFLTKQTDVSAQRLLETNRKLKALLEYHHSVLGSIPTGIVVVEKNGKIRTFNMGARQITGFAQADIAGRTLDDLPLNLKPVSDALRRTIEEEKTFVQDHLDLKTDRSETVTLTLETSVLRAGNGEILGAVATLKDMSLRRQMEMQLLRSERFSALGEMAAGVAHEIKNPLNAVLGFSRRLSDNIEDPKLKKYADIISTEVLRMDSIVNDVLEYSQPNRILKTKADVNGILEETVAFLHEKLDQGGIVVQKSLDNSISAVPLDIARIRQVLLNIMLNAIQAMPQGGRLTLKSQWSEGFAPHVKGPVDEKTLYQQLFLQQKMAAISIEDTGHGISKENLSKLFHPFFTTKSTGTGLGLSICHKIVTAHGGRLDVQTEVGKGSIFTIYLPMDEE